MGKWRAAMATGKPFEAVYRARRADGAYRWFLSRAAPLRDESCWMRQDSAHQTESAHLTLTFRGSPPLPVMKDLSLGTMKGVVPLYARYAFPKRASSSRSSTSLM